MSRNNILSAFDNLSVPKLIKLVVQVGLFWKIRATILGVSSTPSNDNIFKEWQDASKSSKTSEEVDLQLDKSSSLNCMFWIKLEK